MEGGCPVLVSLQDHACLLQWARSRSTWTWLYSTLFRQKTLLQWSRMQPQCQYELVQLQMLLV